MAAAGSTGGAATASSLNGTWFARVGWRDWGFEPDPASRSSYLKYSASISRDFYFNVFHKVHLNGAWFGGRDLDRFAKYQFGMFDDTRIHGVPASGARFEELGMMRGSYSFNIFEQYRLDLFLEQAWGRDRALDRGVAADHRYRRRREPARAMGYDSPRGRRQELPSRTVSGDRLGHAADPPAEAAPLTDACAR